MAPKAAPKAQAKAAIRPRNGRPCLRGLLGHFAKPAWLRRIDRMYRNDSLTSLTSQIVTVGTARHVAEYLLRQSPAEQGRVFHLLQAESDNAFDPAMVDAIGDKVAAWQIANMDDLSYIRTKPAHRDNDRKGWQFGALYVGMMNWAALPGNDQFYAPFRQISEDNEWQDHRSGQYVL